MEIVVLILKIIGIIILVLLGILLTLLLLVLFFPLSYRLSVSYNEDVKARAKVHWLFHLVSVTLDYGDGVKTCILRLFGIPLMDFLNPKPKREKQKKKSVKKEAEKAETSVAPESVQPDVTLEDFESAAEGMASEYKDGKVVTDEVLAETDGMPTEADETTPENEEGEEKLSLWQKIKKTIDTIIQKIKDLIQKGIDVKEKIDQWVKILQRERTKVALIKVKDQVIKLLKHILPRKWNAYVEMGFDDPATTGKILGYYWMFIGLYGNHFVCVPNFEKKVLTANVDAKGRIQLVRLVYVVFKFLFDKDLVYLRKVISKANSQ